MLRAPAPLWRRSRRRLMARAASAPSVSSPRWPTSRWFSGAPGGRRLVRPGSGDGRDPLEDGAPGHPW
eukprot:1819482-Lingulodinium_polyedra.AAC.1